jgi:hypothetical protein
VHFPYGLQVLSKFSKKLSVVREDLRIVQDEIATAKLIAPSLDSADEEEDERLTKVRRRERERFSTAVSDAVRGRLAIGAQARAVLRRGARLH